MNEPTHIHILQAQHRGTPYILAICATLEEAQALKDYGEETDMPHYGYCYGYERVYIRSLPIGYRDNLLPKELPCQASDGSIREHVFLGEKWKCLDRDTNNHR